MKVFGHIHKNTEMCDLKLVYYLNYLHFLVTHVLFRITLVQFAVIWFVSNTLIVILVICGYGSFVKASEDDYV